MHRRELSYKAIAADEGKRVRTVLQKELNVSTRFLRVCRDHGDILLNGEHIRTVDLVKEGDVLTLVFPETAISDRIIPEEIPIAVLYEDEDFLALNKQPGIPVHPSKGHPSGTVLNGLAGLGIDYEPHLISRLDLDTSGILLIGKNAYVQERLADMHSRGQVIKTYYAILDGIPREREGIIDLPIGQPDPEKVLRAIVPEEKGGFPSRTRYRLLAEMQPAEAEDGSNNVEFSEKTRLSVVECRLETGRTHQIRVHMKAMGAPLLGDALYGRPSGLINRQALHSACLSFPHPVTGEQITIEAPLPMDMKEVLHTCQNGNVQSVTATSSE